jgi:hypothetical protein
MIVPDAFERTAGGLIVTTAALVVVVALLTQLQSLAESVTHTCDRRTSRAAPAHRALPARAAAVTRIP